MLPILENLARFALEEDAFQVPFTLTIRGVTWSIATNRACVVGFKSPSDYKPWDATAERIATVSRFFEAPLPENSITVNLSDLTLWLEDVDDFEDATSRVLGVMLNAHLVKQAIQDLPFKKVLLSDAYSIAGMACLCISAQDKYRAFIGGVLAKDIKYPAFDPNQAKNAFDLVMNMT